MKRLNTEERIRRILTTRLGARVMMPLYGSLLHELIDKSVDDAWVLDAISYTYEAIERNEPDVHLKKVSVSTGEGTSIRIEYEDGEGLGVVILSMGEVSDGAA